MRLKHLFTCILLHSILLPMDYNDENSTTYSYLPDGTLLSKEYGLKYIGRKGESNGVIGIASGADSVTTDVPSFSDPQIAERPSLIVIGKTEYSGNIIYKNGKLDKVLFPGGYCTFDSENNSQPIFHYFTQDHLGNNRTVTNEDGTVEQITHYYPFGGTFNDAGLNASLQQYKYNGKELDRVAGLNTYDYGARQYFSALPVWDRMDPKCEEDYEVSPYAYCRNNPIKNIDKDGNEVINGFDTTKPKEQEATETYINFINDTYNAIILFGHGNSTGIRLNYNGTNKFYANSNDFIEFLNQNSQVWQNRYILNKQIEIVLFSCDTGKSQYGFPSFAQNISSDIKDISIFAPESEISIYCKTGTMRIDDGKNWKEFKNGKLLNEYDGNNNVPGTDEFNSLDSLKWEDLDLWSKFWK